MGFLLFSPRSMGIHDVESLVGERNREKKEEKRKEREKRGAGGMGLVVGREREKQQSEGGVMLGELSRDDDMEKSRPLLLICYAFGTSPALALWYFFSFFSFSFYFPLLGRREDFWDFHLSSFLLTPSSN